MDDPLNFIILVKAIFVFYVFTFNLIVYILVIVVMSNIMCLEFVKFLRKYLLQFATERVT